MDTKRAYSTISLNHCRSSRAHVCIALKCLRAMSNAVRRATLSLLFCAHTGETKGKEERLLLLLLVTVESTRVRTKLTLIEYLKHRFLQLHSRISDRDAESLQRGNNDDTQSTTSRCLARSIRLLQSIVDKEKPSKSHWPSTDNRTLHLATRRDRGRSAAASRHPLLPSLLSLPLGQHARVYACT